MDTTQNNQHSITVAVFGAPNCGKSTLANSILNSEVCMVSSKPHTTREPTLAIYTKDNMQIVFVDTPGIGTGKTKIEISLASQAKKNSYDADLCLFLFDASKKIPIHILEFAKNLQKPKIAFLNKIDLINKGRLLPLTQVLKEVFDEIFSGSALINMGLEPVLQSILQKTKPQEWNYQQTVKTTRQLDQIINDRTKEVIFEVMSDEIPYNSEVRLTEINEKKDKSLIIRQDICIKHGYRHIFLGHIKTISTKAREKIKNVLGREVHLFIEIKCKK